MHAATDIRHSLEVNRHGGATRFQTVDEYKNIGQGRRQACL